MKHIFPPKDMMRMMWQLATGNRLHSLYAPPLCQIQDDRDVINIRTETTFNILFLCSQSHRQEIVFIVVASVCVCMWVRAGNAREYELNCDCKCKLYCTLSSIVFFVGFLSLSFFRFINLPFHPLACSHYGSNIADRVVHHRTFEHTIHK